MGKKHLQHVISPLKNVRTFEAVSEQLKELIFNGTLKPGEQLPSETALAEMFQVGRQSVREGLRVLELSGFITIKPGTKGGAVIESTIFSKIGSLFLDAFKFDKVSMADLLSARKAIEIMVLDFVLDHADQNDIAVLRNNIRQARQRIKSGHPAFEENIEFHRLLAAASKNYVFCLVVESLLTILADFKSRFSFVHLDQSTRIVDFHEAVVNAIENKEKQKARDMFEADLEEAIEIFKGMGYDG